MTMPAFIRSADENESLLYLDATRVYDEVQPYHPDSDNSRFRFPGRVPGEPGMWILIIGDMTIFTVIFCSFLSYRSQDPESFAAARTSLQIELGTLNTVVLLTSSLFVALGVSFFRLSMNRTSARMFATGIAFGAVFCFIKILEWYSHLGAGVKPQANMFYMFYFVITGLHFVHMIIGVVALVFAYRRLKNPSNNVNNQRLIIECGASYWHMVDLLWIVIFPLLYLAST